MKIILVDAVNALIVDNKIDHELFSLLETYPNRKILLTGAAHEKFSEYGLDKAPYEVFTLQQNPPKSNPEYYSRMLVHFDLSVEEIVYFEHDKKAVKTARSLGIMTHHFTERNLVKLKEFIDANL